MQLYPQPRGMRLSISKIYLASDLVAYQAVPIDVLNELNVENCLLRFQRIRYLHSILSVCVLRLHCFILFRWIGGVRAFCFVSFAPFSQLISCWI